MRVALPRRCRFRPAAPLAVDAAAASPLRDRTPFVPAAGALLSAAAASGGGFSALPPSVVAAAAPSVRKKFLSRSRRNRRFALWLKVYGRSPFTIALRSQPPDVTGWAELPPPLPLPPSLLSLPLPLLLLSLLLLLPLLALLLLPLSSSSLSLWASSARARACRLSVPRTPVALLLLDALSSAAGTALAADDRDRRGFAGVAIPPAKTCARSPSRSTASTRCVARSR